MVVVVILLISVVVVLIVPKEDKGVVLNVCGLLIEGCECKAFVDSTEKLTVIADVAGLEA